MILRADRPIIVGCDNPHSDDPERALETTCPGSAGWRLWKLSGLTREAYERSFQRVNVSDMPEIPNRSRVVVLGREAWRALGLPFVVPLDEVALPGVFTTFTYVPHPSGKNLWYNDQENCRRVGELLRRLAREEVPA